MAAREVELVGQHFLSCMGRAEDWDPEQFDQVRGVVVGGCGSSGVKSEGEQAEEWDPEQFDQVRGVVVGGGGCGG